MDLNTVLLIGKPGSGKGTQAALLAEKTGWQTIASGDLFRALMKEDTEVGAKMREEIEKGLLAPDWFAMYLFQKSVLTLSSTQGVIFDGFGRKVPEAKVVVDVLTWLGRPFTAVHVKVSDAEIIDRLEKRKGVSGRADDHAVEKRLDEYRIFTEPSIEVFREAGKLVEVNGEGEVDAIQAEIRKALNLG